MKRAMAVICSLALFCATLPAAVAATPDEPQIAWLKAYDEVDYFNCGYAMVCDTPEDEYYFIDPLGNRLEMDDDYIIEDRFSNGLAPVSLKSGDKFLVGWIGTDGKLKIPVEYLNERDLRFRNNVIFALRDDYRQVTLKTDGTVLAEVPDDTIVIPLGEYVASWNGLQPAYLQDHRMGFVDRNWETVIPFQYYNVSANNRGFQEGGAEVVVVDEDHNMSAFYINCAGEQITEAVDIWESELTSGFMNGFVEVRNEDGLWGFIDTHGELAIPYQYEDFSTFLSGYIFVTTDRGQDKWDLIDTNGKTILKDIQADAYNYYRVSEGLAAICRDGLWGYIDIQGREVIPCIYAEAYDFNEGYAWVRRSDGVWGVLTHPFAQPSAWAEQGIKDASLCCIQTERVRYNYQTPATRLQCAELMANLVEVTTGRPILEAEASRFSDTNDWMARKMAAIGLVKGSGDGSIFDPEGVLTREQLATMVCRTIRYLEEQTGKTVLTHGDLSGYIDADQIHDWALESVSDMTASGLIKGTSGNTLSPELPAGVEQAILLTLRVYQAFRV